MALKLSSGIVLLSAEGQGLMDPHIVCCLDPVLIEKGEPKYSKVTNVKFKETNILKTI